MSYDQFWTIFSWATGINLAIYAFTAIAMLLLRDWMVRIQGAMMGLERADMLRLYANYLAAYKLVLIVFFIGPWLAMWIVG